MADVFHNGIDALKELIAASGAKGPRKESNGEFHLKSQRGGMLGYWPSTYTVSAQGRPPGKEDLEAVLVGADVKAAAVVFARTEPVRNPKVFFVHGSRRDPRTQLDAMLRRWGLAQSFWTRCRPRA